MRRTIALLAFTVPGVVLFAQRPPQPRPVLLALDVDHDGQLSAAEIEEASKSLLTLDLNHDGQLTPDEILPKEPGQGASPDEMVARLMTFDKNGDQELTAEELPARMQGLLQRGDTNHDGKLSADEIRALYSKQRGPQGRTVEPGKASGVFRMDPVLDAIDTNHDAVFSAQEIAAASSSLKTLDTNHDGILSPDELKMHEMTPQQRANHLFEEWDTNKDGKISKEEAPDRMQAQFESIDLNQDGFLTVEEVTVFYASQQNKPNTSPRGQRPNTEEKK